MTTVYVMERGIDYEGSDVLAVFSTLDAAKAAYPDTGWIEKPLSDGGIVLRAGGMPKGLSGDDLFITTYTLDEVSR